MTGLTLEQINALVHSLLPVANQGDLRAIDTLIIAVGAAPHLQHQQTILSMVGRAFSLCSPLSSRLSVSYSQIEKLDSWPFVF